MKIGTKSVLYGAHCFLIHPWFVMFAWWKLYGFPNDIRLWVAFFVHDLGYIGKINMDGIEGETHVELGARIMHIFDLWQRREEILFNPSRAEINAKIEQGYKLKRAFKYWGPWLFVKWERSYKWHNFSLYHSRFYAKKDGVQFTALCVADKLAICLEPAWLYLPRVRWTGEINEYMNLAVRKKYDGEPVSKYETMSLSTKSAKDWHTGMTSYLRRWVEEHKDGREDTWTPGVKKAIDLNGVYQ